MRTVRFQKKYASELAEMYFKDYFSDKPNKKDYMPQIRRFISKMSPEYSFIAKNKDMLIGVILAYLVPQADNVEGFLYIQSIEVLEEYRGHGIAKSLLKKTLDKARKTDIEFVNLDVNKESKEVKDWYGRIGFGPNEYDSLWANLKDISI